MDDQVRSASDSYESSLSFKQKKLLDFVKLALFQIACFKNNQQAVREFLELKFPLDCRSSFDIEEWKGFTPLHFSVSGPRGSTVDLLIRSKADILAVDEKGRTPIHLAFRNDGDENYFLMRNCYLLETWLSSLVDKVFSNLEDQYGLNFFHILCCGRYNDNSNKLTNAVKFILKSNVDINYSVSLYDPDYPGYTALHFAVRNSRLDITKLLLEHGADLTKTNKEGSTPLHMVLDHSILQAYRFSGTFSQRKKERIEIVKLLVNRGADVDVRDLKGCTPLHHAFSSVSPETKNDQSLVQLLLSKSKLDSNYIDSHGLSYLHIASSMDLAAVKTLLGKTEKSSLDCCIDADAEFKSGHSPLHLAVSFGKVDIVEYLLDQGADPNMGTHDKKKLTPLHLACTFTHSECYPYDERHRKNSSTSDVEQLHESGKINIVELLLVYGASANKKDSSGNSPLLVACTFPEHNFATFHSVSYILEQIYDDQRTIIEKCLHYKADVHLLNNDGDSVLHLIAGQQVRGGFPQRKMLAEKMLKKGVKINAVNKTKLTPLHVAVKNSVDLRWDTSLIELFLEYGADVNAISREGGILHIAVNKFVCGDQSNEIIFPYLINLPEIDLNIQTTDFGNTPLHVAGNLFASSITSFQYLYVPGGELHVKRKCFCIEELLNAGANVNILNVDGLTPLHKVFQWLMMDSSRSHPRHLDYFTYFMTHMKKLEKMNVFIGEKVKESLTQLSKVDLEKSLAIEISIDEESEKLKSKMVDQYTSYYEILLKDANGMSKHVKNENFKEMISSPDLSIDFPLFHAILKRKFEAGLARSLLLESAKEALETVLQVFWPYSCTEHILEYLSNDNLKSLIKSVSVEKSLKRKRDCLPSINDTRSKIAKM
ncbi:hypothetical protein QAD02_006337 [Eretmocerus hayati]|uniref:Uncharacterized protein n=1 Tax=Eretmocerus hayati TaxID=131215 RepID=A0ACC2N0L7_9HYME|nr:hypothetical protein QAD02_006337 [Eretmocerus hayati]